MTNGGLKLIVAPDGSPLALRLTVCAEPVTRVVTIVAVALAPCVMVRVSGLALIAKSLGFTDRRAVPLPACEQKTLAVQVPPAADAGIFCFQLTAPRPDALLAPSFSVVFAWLILPLHDAPPCDVFAVTTTLCPAITRLGATRTRTEAVLPSASVPPTTSPTITHAAANTRSTLTIQARPCRSLNCPEDGPT
jgi:hypothetical protein